MSDPTENTTWNTNTKTMHASQHTVHNSLPFIGPMAYQEPNGGFIVNSINVMLCVQPFCHSLFEYCTTVLAISSSCVSWKYVVQCVITTTNLFCYLLLDVWNCLQNLFHVLLGLRTLYCVSWSAHAFSHISAAWPNLAIDFISNLIIINM